MVQGTRRNRVYRGGFESSARAQSVSLESVPAGEYSLMEEANPGAKVLGRSKKEDVCLWQRPLLSPSSAPPTPDGRGRDQVWAGFLGS